MNTTRRDFLKVGAGAVAATSAVSANSNESFSSIASGRSAAASAGDEGNMIYRRFGRTDVQISAIGVGGHHLGDLPTLDEAVQLVHEAVDAGVTFFDNAWEYYNGKTETILGRALRDGRREKVFLMTKVCTHGRSGYRTPCRLRKAGMTVIRRVPRAHGHRVPLFVNFVAGAKALLERPKAHDAARVLRGGHLRVLRLRAH